jgi:thiosulfate dehydrogenase [quinone] large subunit
LDVRRGTARRTAKHHPEVVMSSLLDPPTAAPALDRTPDRAEPTTGRAATARAEAAEAAPRRAPLALGLARMGLGWLFLWAFVDKLVGLGFSTPGNMGWIDGGNPTQGYLGSAEGPFAGFYESLAGGAVTNVLFMAGLLALGVALTAGVASRLATIGGVVMFVSMWTTHMLPETNPFLDEHLIYALVLIGLLGVGADRTLGLGARWAELPIVRRFPILR